jgi:hypothetical protein
MSAHALQPLPQTLLRLTKPFSSRATLRNAYGIFHIDLDPSSAKLVEHVLSVSADQDRLHFAEEYAVLGVTDLQDAKWFRRGVWLKETVPATRYPEQRDHSVHIH